MREGYKKTLIGEIPTTWTIDKLNNITDVRDGTHDSPNQLDKGIPFVTSKNLKSNGLDLSDISYISYKDHVVISKRSKVDKGDILFGMIGSIGNPVIVDLHFDISIKNVALIKFHESKLNNVYLNNLLKSELIKKQFQRKANGGVQKFIALGMIRDLDIPVPPFIEQQKIATILSSVDEHIDEVGKMIKDLKELKGGLMQKLLTEGIGHTEFKNSAVGRIPAKWEVKKLGEIVDFRNGYAFNAKSYSLNGKKIIRMSNISVEGNLQVRNDNVKYCSNDFYDSLKEFHLYKDDLVICMTDVTPKRAIIGRTAIIDKDSEYILNQRVGRMQIVNNEKIIVNYLHHYTNFEQYLKHIRNISGGSAQANASTKEILNTDIKIPPIEEQIKISNLLDCIDSRIYMYRLKMTDIQQLKKALMQQILTGKTRVKIDN